MSHLSITNVIIKMKRAIFPGTFDPFTIGHFNIVKRGLDIFDEIIIGVGNNINKKTLFDAGQRIAMIQSVFEGERRVIVKAYNVLTVDFAAKYEAGFILRGLRTVADYEYEHTIAAANRRLTGVETVMIFTEIEHSYISSTVVRDLISFGKDVTPFLPPNMKLDL